MNLSVPGFMLSAPVTASWFKPAVYIAPTWHSNCATRRRLPSACWMNEELSKPEPTPWLVPLQMYLLPSENTKPLPVLSLIQPKVSPLSV